MIICLLLAHEVLLNKIAFKKTKNYFNGSRKPPEHQIFMNGEGTPFLPSREVTKFSVVPMRPNFTCFSIGVFKVPEKTLLL